MYCDTENWSNDTENSALISGLKYILQDIQIENTFKIIIIFQNTSFCCIFDQINAGLVSRRDFFQKHEKIYLMKLFQASEC